jgi:hypothetical protein
VAIVGLIILVFMLGYTIPKEIASNTASPFTTTTIIQESTPSETGTFKFTTTNIIIPYQGLEETATIQQMQNAGTYPKFK